jgi:RNA-directed DNA polymerase
MEAEPAIVPMAKQAGDVHDRWAWTEPSVWTERMLIALERGVKGGYWFSLIDKVYSQQNLRAAFTQVKANHGAAGVDHVTIEIFEEDLEANLARMSQQLAAYKYEPQAVRR